MPRRTRRRVESLYYITHVENVPSILKEGILSHRQVEQRGIPFKSIYDAQIVSNRQQRPVRGGDSLWDFANLYFQPRNPMLYRVIFAQKVDSIAIVAVRPEILQSPHAHISFGNAASYLSDIVPASNGLNTIELEMQEVLGSDWWREEDGSKRKIMAEVLVPDRVAPENILSIFVASRSLADSLRSLVGAQAQHVPIVPEPHMFFRPRRQMAITPSLSLAEGDMFFSHMQTLTISVNTVGVMGKGLASRAKYQFPDLYVYYQDLCRQKTLTMGHPQLYTRETSLDLQLADDSGSLDNLNQSKWFLLFPTKKHWKDKSPLEGIETGLRWLRDHYQSMGIQSLALPALGCGLGELSWEDVGPLMCSYLADLAIEVVIYLPQEREIPESWITKEFLLRPR